MKLSFVSAFATALAVDVDVAALVPAAARAAAGNHRMAVAAPSRLSR